MWPFNNNNESNEEFTTKAAPYVPPTPSSKMAYNKMKYNAEKRQLRALHNSTLRHPRMK